MPKAVFDSLEEAKAAFSLGPVKFRCNICGGWHTSNRRGWKYCLWELIEDLADEELHTFPELKQLLSERWLPPAWLLPKVESACRQLQEVRDKLEAHCKAFRLPGWLGIDGSSFEILSLSKKALRGIIENTKSTIQKDICRYESSHRDEVEELRSKYLELKKYLINSSAYMKSFFTTEATNQIDNMVAMRIGLINIRDIWYPPKLLVDDFLRVFPELERPYEIKGPGERFRSLTYVPRMPVFRDEGFYCMLEAQFLRRYSTYSRQRRRSEFHVLHIKDYEKPVYLGVVEHFRGVITMERAIKEARPRTED